MPALGLPLRLGVIERAPDVLNFPVIQPLNQIGRYVGRVIIR